MSAQEFIERIKHKNIEGKEITTCQMVALLKMLEVAMNRITMHTCVTFSAGNCGHCQALAELDCIAGGGG